MDHHFWSAFVLGAVSMFVGLVALTGATLWLTSRGEKPAPPPELSPLDKEIIVAASVAATSTDKDWVPAASSNSWSYLNGNPELVRLAIGGEVAILAHQHYDTRFRAVQVNGHDRQAQIEAAIAAVKERHAAQTEVPLAVTAVRNGVTAEFRDARGTPLCRRPLELFMEHFFSLPVHGSTSTTPEALYPDV